VLGALRAGEAGGADSDSRAGDAGNAGEATAPAAGEGTP
jgi:hypothetical protein